MSAAAVGQPARPPGGSARCALDVAAYLGTTWLDDPTVPRTAVEQMLLASFTGLLTAAAEHDTQAQQVALRLRSTDRLPEH